MKRAVRRLAIVAMGMFLVLFGSTTYVQYFAADSLNADGRNSRTLYREFGRDRGPILVAGKPVAESVPVDDAFKFQREYPFGARYAAVTGYYSVVYGPTAIERAMNDALNGTADSQFYNRLRDLVTGQQPRGGSVELTIDPKLQEIATKALGDQRGAVVALDPRTGAILALVTSPTFDPNKLAGHNTAEVNAAYQKLLADPNRPLDNRAIASHLYPPGSVFKLVTAAAALESGDWTAASALDAPRELSLPLTSATIKNYGGSSCGAAQISLADALRVSCNTSFAQLGMDLGDEQLRKQAEAFGFGKPLSIPLPVTPSTFPADLNAPQTAQAAIGQYDVRVTPLEIAQISAAIAQGGVPMKPYLVQTVRAADLTVTSRTEPEALPRAVSAATASALRDMMVSVVESGTGKAAQLSGVSVAGKTGTAQHAPGEAPHAWFTAFAPAEDPQIVVAVVIENGGSLGSEATGGRLAAPIARSLIKEVVNR